MEFTHGSMGHGQTLLRCDFIHGSIMATSRNLRNLPRIGSSFQASEVRKSRKSFSPTAALGPQPLFFLTLQVHNISKGTIRLRLADWSGNTIPFLKTCLISESGNMQLRGICSLGEATKKNSSIDRFDKKPTIQRENRQTAKTPLKEAVWHQQKHLPETVLWQVIYVTPFHKAQDLTESAHQKKTTTTEGTVFKAPPMEDREEFVKFFSNLGHVMSWCHVVLVFCFLLTLLVHKLCEDHAPHKRC